MNDITNDTPVPPGAYRVNLQAWTETDGKRLKVSSAIEHHKDGESPERIVMEKVIDLEDAAIRDGLQALGWVAPAPVDEAIARLNLSLRDQPPSITPSSTMHDALVATGWTPPGEASPVIAILQAIRKTLHEANGLQDSPIQDTIWHGPGETLFDFIDNTLALYGVVFPENEAQGSLPI